MKTLWSAIDSPDMPYVYQKISVNNKKLYVTYGIVGNHDFEVSFYKEYENEKQMEEIFLQFRKNTDSKEKKEWPQLTDLTSGYDRVQVTSQLELIEKALNHQLELPEQGVGFSLLTDVATLEYCRQGCLEALSEFNKTTF